MATSKISIDEGSTLNTATNTITEDAVTKHIPRSVLNSSAGVEIVPATAAQIGEVQATPTSNTLLDRVKALLTGTILAAGTNIIGNVRIDQTTPGTTNAVTANAGTNLNTSTLATSAQVGEVQASPTANTVLDRLKALLTGIILAAGTNLIGKVGIDQTTPGTTNAVQANAGTNLNTSTLATSAQIGEVQASPTANTLLDRVKALLTGIVLAAGTNLIGKVSIDQTTDGTTNKVAATLAAETTKVIGTVNVAAAQTIGLAAGTAEIGKLAAGTALIGKVGIDQSTANANEVVLKTGSTTAVTSGTAANCKVAATLDAETTKVIGTVNDKVADGDLITLGAKADNKSTATDTTAVSAMSVLKEISYMEQNPASRAVTNAGTFAVQCPPVTSGGLSIFRSIDLDESEEDVKGSAGQIYGWYIQNKNVATLFLKFYNATAANTTVGTTTPILTIPVPAGAAANVSFTHGIAFDTALCAAVTTGVADNDTGAPAANDFIANIFYK